jgi:hypothetical protein
MGRSPDLQLASSNFCPRPYTLPTNTTGLFTKPKPCHARASKVNGKRLKVLHMLDFHLDPRFAVGSEANCTCSLCCRTNNNNTALHPGQISLRANPYGNYKCDSPYDLGLAALQAVGPLTGTSLSNPLGWTVYTGDLVSHKGQNELSRLYVEYAESSVYSMFKTYITGPVFAALGNQILTPKPSSVAPLPSRSPRPTTILELQPRRRPVKKQRLDKHHAGRRSTSALRRLLDQKPLQSGCHYLQHEFLVPQQLPDIHKYHRPRQLQHLHLDGTRAATRRGRRRACVAHRACLSWLGRQQTAPESL